MGQKIAFIIVILIGLFLRLYQINSVPAGFFIDEVAMAVDAKSLVENGTDQYGRSYPFGFEDLTDYKLPGYLYPAAVGYMIFGPTLIAIRAPAVAASVVSLFLLWYLARWLYPNKKYFPYYTSAALALCYYHIQFGRIAYESMFATAFFILYLTAIVKIVRNRRRNFWYIVGSISLIVCMWTYPAVRFIIPIFTFLLLVICYFTKPNGVKPSDLIRAGVFFLILAVLAFIPSVLNSNLDKRPLSYILIDSKGTWYQILSNKLFSTLSSWLRMFNLEYLFSKGDAFAYRHGTRETGIYPPIFAIPFLLGVWYYIREFSKRSFPLTFLGLLIIVIGIPSALTSSTPYGPRLLAITIPFSILIGLGCEQGVQIVSKYKLPIRRTVYAVLTIVLVYQVAYFTHIYFVHYKTLSLPEFPKAEVDLGRLVAKERADHPENRIYFLNGKSCRLWSHDDLNLWYFADLPDNDMIKWNNLFRDVRYKAKGSPFDAYDNSQQPRYSFDHMIMNASYEEMDTAPKNSLMIRCGYRLPYMKDRNEKIEKIIYMYGETNQDPFYIVSRKL